jgi:hypothetical protein
MTASSSGRPEAAKTPAVITALSLGTTGKKPSMAASANSRAYTQGEDIAP